MSKKSVEQLEAEGRELVESFSNEEITGEFTDALTSWTEQVKECCSESEDEHVLRRLQECVDKLSDVTALKRQEAKSKLLNQRKSSAGANTYKNHQR